VTVDSAALAEALHKVPIFADLPNGVIRRLAEQAETVELLPGGTLIREGDEADGLFVVLDGQFDVTQRMGEDEIPTGGAQAGEVVGEMALLEGGKRTATVRAVTSARTLRISRDAFQEMIATEPTAAAALVRKMAGHLRATQSMLQQREKLASLGTLAAGLAHELNNPAAAVRRSASLLQEAFIELGHAAQALADVELDARGRAAVAVLREQREAIVAAPAALDPLEQSDLAAQLEEYLDERGVEDAWRFASPLAVNGWSPDRLNEIALDVGDGVLPVVARWLAAVAAIQSLLAEILAASERIGELVTAVKSYTFMDQAPVQDVDIAAGLENTLLIMRHKLKAGVTVVREFDPDLPRIEAFGSELNQVWTNIIDNAIDAMQGEGVLTLRTSPTSDGCILVEICNDGPVIPESVQRKMFEPFFTTKEPGKGTGLGLHIVYSIVVGHHHGRLSVTSVPGETCFHVTLPAILRLPPGSG